MGLLRCKQCVFVYLCIADKTYLLNLMPCTNLGRPLSVVRISVLLKVSQMGYRYRVVPYRLWKFCATSERPRQSQTKFIMTKKMSVTHISCFAKLWKHIQKATCVVTGIYRLLWNHGPTGQRHIFSRHVCFFRLLVACLACSSRSSCAGGYQLAAQSLVPEEHPYAISWIHTGLLGIAICCANMCKWELWS